MSWGETFKSGGVAAPAGDPVVTAVSSTSGNEGTNLVHTVTLSNPVALAAATYAYSLGGGTSTSVSDYTVPPTFSAGVTLSGGTLTVPSGVSSFTVTVAALTDGSTEGSETYNLTIGGVTGVGTIGDVAGSLITPTFLSIPSSVTAPFTIHLDASATTAAAYTAKPFHDLHYRWVVGDGSTATHDYGVQPGVRLRNVMFGPSAAYCLETPGTAISVTLYVTNPGTGDVATFSRTIDVIDPAVTYSGTNTIAISSVALPVAGVGGVPAGAQCFLETTLTAAYSHVTANTKRILFKRGETFSSSADYTLAYNNIQQGAYGTGADPIFTIPGVLSPNTYRTGIIITTSGSLNFTMMDCKWDGVDHQNAASGTEYHKWPVNINSSSGIVDGNITMLRVETNEMSEGFSSGGLRYTAVVDCNFHNFSGGQGNVGVWMTEGIYGAIIGSRIVDCFDIEHTTRLQGNSNMVINNNDLAQAGMRWSNGGIGRDKQIIALRGSSSGYTWTGRWVEHCVVSENLIDGGANGTGLASQVAPQSSGHDERLRNNLLESNWFTGDIGQCITSESETLTVRNNLAYGPMSGFLEVLYQSSTTANLPDDNVAYNNSIYSTSTDQFNCFKVYKTYASTGSTNMSPPTFINNIAYAPSAIRDTFNNSPAKMIVAAGLVLPTYTDTTNSSNAQVTGTVPGFTIPPTTLTQWKITSGYGLNGGTAVPVYDDFSHVARTGTFDLGGVNP